MNFLRNYYTFIFFDCQQIFWFKLEAEILKLPFLHIYNIFPWFRFFSVDINDTGIY